MGDPIQNNTFDDVRKSLEEALNAGVDPETAAKLQEITGMSPDEIIGDDGKISPKEFTNFQHGFIKGMMNSPDIKTALSPEKREQIEKAMQGSVDKRAWPISPEIKAHLEKDNAEKGALSNKFQQEATSVEGDELIDATKAEITSGNNVPEANDIKVDPAPSVMSITQ